MKLKLMCGMTFALSVVSVAWADSLELRNGSLIKGKFVGGTESYVSFQVGSSIQKYNINDIVSLKFDSEPAGNDSLKRRSSLSGERETARPVTAKLPAYVTIPAGTRVSVRMIDGVDSTQNHPGDRFQCA